MNNIDWVIILLSAITLFIAIYVGVKIGEYRMRKSFISSVFKSSELPYEDVEYADDIYIDTSDQGPLN